VSKVLFYVTHNLFKFLQSHPILTELYFGHVPDYTNHSYIFFDHVTSIKIINTILRFTFFRKVQGDGKYFTLFCKNKAIDKLLKRLSSGNKTIDYNNLKCRDLKYLKTITFVKLNSSTACCCTTMKYMIQKHTEIMNIHR